MAALKASELKYGVPLRVALGAGFLTATRVEIPASKEYEVGTLELNLAKLGLTSQSVVGAQIPGVYGQGSGPEVGAVASTTAAPAVAWCTPLTVSQKVDAESAVEVAEGYLAQISNVKGKLILRIYGITTAGDGKPVNEAKTATKITFTAAQAVTVFVVSK